jgi:glutaminyl-tRNA synthetase
MKKDASGRVIELRCTYDPETRGGNNPPDGRKVKGTIHWVSEAHSVVAEVRLYDRLFMAQFPGSGDSDFLKQINPNSLEVLKEVRVEPALAQAQPESRWQFERTGYFVADRHDSKPGKPVFNRTVTLKDSWAKEQSQA